MDSNKLQGVFHRKKNGDAYVSYIENNEKIHIPMYSGYNVDIFDGDIINFSLQYAEKSKKAPAAKFVSLKAHSRDKVIGIFDISGGKAYVIPDEYIPFRIMVKQSPHSPPCMPGDRVEAEIQKYKALSAIRVIVTENFGKADTYKSKIKSAVAGTPHFTPFSKDAEREAMIAKPHSGASVFAGRVSLKTKTVFTLTDSVFDSNCIAFSAEKDENGWQIGVHIADVAEYIKDGSEIDRQASSRGRQVYGTRDGSPMVPTSFIDTVCSFSEGRESLALSLFLSYDSDGNLTDTDITESVICPTVTASANDVDVLISSFDSSALMPLRLKYAAVIEPILSLYELAAALRLSRIKSGGVDFDTVSRLAGIDSAMKIRKSVSSGMKDSVLMINEILYSAGAALAEKLYYNGVPCYFKGVNEEMYDDVTGYPDYNPLVPSHDYTSHGYYSAEANVSRGTFFEQSCFRRLTCANDTPLISKQPIRHCILGYDKYTEMFRPSERYSDLVNQRSVKCWLHGEAFDIRKYDTAIANEIRTGVCKNKLNQICNAFMISESKGNKFEAYVSQILSQNVEDNTVSAKVYLFEGVSATVSNLPSNIKAGDRVSVTVSGAEYTPSKINPILE